MKGESFLKVQYDLRPAKQVERRMLVDALQILSMDVFPIRDYQYTGMGSIFFADFLLFHKVLGMDRMVSVEISPSYQRRVEFNKPCDFVKIEIGRIGDYIPSLSGDLKHLLWLDYDNTLLAEHLQDVALSGTYLTKGSILLVTVDIEPPVSTEAGGDPAQWQEYFSGAAAQYLDPGWTRESFSRSNLRRINIDILERAIRAGLSGRDHVEFLPLFNFVYADGHEMLTIGGMIGGLEEKRRLKASRLSERPYARIDLRQEPYVIRVPRLTRKERLFLDSQMPCPAGWQPEEFEIPATDLEVYAEIYRFLPSYGEFLV